MEPYTDINQQHWEFPFLDKLIIDWRVLLHDTGDELRVPEDFWDESPIRHVEINVGNRSTGIKERSADNLSRIWEVTHETGDILAHLHLPVLESAVIRIDHNHAILNGGIGADVLSKRIKVHQWKETLKRWDLTFSFDLGDDPDDDFTDVSFLLRRSICTADSLICR
jgi:hypothetical protein